jgi:hypothetical protein
MNSHSRDTAALPHDQAVSAGAGETARLAPARFLLGDMVRFQEDGEFSHELSGRVVGVSFGTGHVDVELADGERINGVANAVLSEDLFQ